MYVPKPTTQWSQVPFWLKAALLIFALDVGSFYIGSIILGGDAARGFRRNDKYYLADRYHTTEVSRAQYYYSQIHLLSLGVAMLVVGIGLKKIPPRTPPGRRP